MTGKYDGFSFSVVDVGRTEENLSVDIGVWLSKDARFATYHYGE